MHELRRLLVTLFVKSIIFYAIESPHFGVWLSDETILKALEGMRHNGRFVDTDPVFCAANDEDYDLNIGGLVGELETVQKKCVGEGGRQFGKTNCLMEIAF